MTRIAVFSLLVPAFALAATADWERRLTPAIPGGFPAPPPLTARYRLGWTSFVAAEADVAFTRPDADEFQLEAQAHTIGLVRALWKLNATIKTLAQASSLQPIRLQQTEEYRSKTVRTELRFDEDSVTCMRSNSRDAGPRKEWRISLPHVYDMHSALLFVRSQPLRMGDSFSLIVCPGATPYLVSAKLVGRGPVQVAAGKFSALKLELKMWRIGDHHELLPHEKFKQAFVWISDDANRLVLRVRADIFVGNVWAELQRVNLS